MTYDDIREAREDATETIRRADIATQQAASLIHGRLRAAGVYRSTLRALKHELQSFNSITGKWKNEK